ncbi:MAG: MarC family protein [Candidatus ainarchaeum sp.]|nr:MarC family protein [Candidatus ainarchaeum sp.]
MELDIILYFILCFTSILIIINPISTIAVYLTISQKMSEPAKKQMLISGSKLAWVILVFFAVTGFALFNIFGLSLGSFEIAGGILLFLIGINMLFSGKEDNDPKDIDHFIEDEFTVVPLTIPFMCGPGSIATTIVLASQALNFYYWVALIFAITLAYLINYIIVKNSVYLKSILKEKGMLVLTKIMGLIVCSIGIEFVVKGITLILPIILSSIQVN